MSDFAVKITVRNNRILKAIRALGYDSVAKFCRENGVDYTRTVQALGFKCRVVAYGEWNEFAFDLSSALHCEPEDLWPEHMRHLKTTQNSIEFSTDESGIRALSAPNETVADVRAIHNLIAKLPERQGYILASRVGIIGPEKTLDELALEQGVGRERIRQIEAKAVRVVKEALRKRGFKDADAFIDKPPSHNV